MTSDENELSEACIKTLTVNIDHAHSILRMVHMENYIECHKKVL